MPGTESLRSILSSLSVQLTMLKAKRAEAPFWPCVVTGHPMIEVKCLKKKEKDMDEVLASLAQYQQMAKAGCDEATLAQMMSSLSKDD